MTQITTNAMPEEPSKPKNYWANPKNRIEAIKELVAKIGKAPEAITSRDFRENGLVGLLNLYQGSPYAALKAAGLTDVKPWEMKVPQGYWKAKENRVRAVQWLINETSKSPSELIARDFQQYGLGGLLQKYFGSACKAVKELFKGGKPKKEQLD